MFKKIFHREKKEKGKYKKPYYTLLSCHTDKVLDLSQGGEHAGSLVIWKSNKGENQSFTFVPCGNGEYHIKCRINKTYLTVEGPHNGARVFAGKKSHQANQKFRIDEKTPDGKEHIIYTYCGKVLDICEASKKEGAQVIQYDFNGGKNQMWMFCEPNNITSSSSEVEWSVISLNLLKLCHLPQIISREKWEQFTS